MSADTLTYEVQADDCSSDHKHLSWLESVKRRWDLTKDQTLTPPKVMKRSSKPKFLITMDLTRSLDRIITVATVVKILPTISSL